MRRRAGGAAGGEARSSAGLFSDGRSCLRLGVPELTQAAPVRTAVRARSPAEGPVEESGSGRRDRCCWGGVGNGGRTPTNSGLCALKVSLVFAGRLLPGFIGPRKSSISFPGFLHTNVKE